MDKLNKVFLIVLAAVGLATIGLQVPAIQEQRGLVRDEQAARDLQDIDNAIKNYVLEKGDLPPSLSELSLSGTSKNRLGNYEYKPGDSGTYELCASFKTDTSKKNQPATGDPSDTIGYLTDDFSVHQKGRQCFTQSGGYNYDSDESSFFGGSTISGLRDGANDSQIQTDINVIQSQLEAYYAGNGFYPTLAQLQDPSWRNINMPGVDGEAFEDPNGATIGLGYSYTAAPSDCQTDCTSYTLSAKLSDGAIYSKQSL